MMVCSHKDAYDFIYNEANTAQVNRELLHGS
jgi:hypothetical protein